MEQYLLNKIEHSKFQTTEQSQSKSENKPKKTKKLSIDILQQKNQKKNFANKKKHTSLSDHGGDSPKFQKDKFFKPYNVYSDIHTPQNMYSNYSFAQTPNLVNEQSSQQFYLQLVLASQQLMQNTMTDMEFIDKNNMNQNLLKQFQPSSTPQYNLFPQQIMFQENQDYENFLDGQKKNSQKRMNVTKKIQKKKQKSVPSSPTNKQYQKPKKKNSFCLTNSAQDLEQFDEQKSKPQNSQEIMNSQNSIDKAQNKKKLTSLTCSKDENVFVCDVPGCNYSTQKYITFWMHKTNKHSNKTYKCEKSGCYYSTTNKQAYENHARYEHQDKIYQCEFGEGSCGFSTKNIKSYQYHCRTKHQKQLTKLKNHQNNLQISSDDMILNMQSTPEVQQNIIQKSKVQQEIMHNSITKLEQQIINQNINKNKKINEQLTDEQINKTPSNYIICQFCGIPVENNEQLQQHYKIFMHGSLYF